MEFYNEIDKQQAGFYKETIINLKSNITCHVINLLNKAHNKLTDDKNHKEAKELLDILVPAYNVTYDEYFGGTGYLFNVEDVSDIKVLLDLKPVEEVLTTCAAVHKLKQDNSPFTKYVTLNPEDDKIQMMDVSRLIRQLTGDADSMVRDMLDCPWVAEYKKVYQMTVSNAMAVTNMV